MILRFIINFVRWSWGFGPLDCSELNPTVEGLMCMGAFIDLMIMAAIVAYVVSVIAEKRGRKK